MKTAIKFLTLILCLVLSTAYLVSCGEELPEPAPDINEWKPDGDTITLMQRGTYSVYCFACETVDSPEFNAAVSLRDKLYRSEFQFSDVISTVAESTTVDLIVFGESNLKASVKAKAFLEEQSAATPDDLHWVFYYFDGKLAIIANCADAYKKAETVLLSRLIVDDAFKFSDTLREHGAVTRASYEAELEDLALIEAEVKRLERNAALSSLLPIYTAQRNEITANNSFGTATENIGTSSWAAAPTTPIDEHPRVFINSSHIPLIRERLKEDNATNARFYELLEYEHPTDGNLGEPTTNFDGRAGLHNYDVSILELIQVKALGYLTEGHELFGYQAIYYMKNFLLTLDIQYISSDQCREYGNTMMTAAIVYDWCYDLLTEEDKAQLIAAVETRTASGTCGDPSYTNTAAYKNKMEVGFPPSGQGSVSGHGSEGQILRNYLAAAIAFYGDNNSWWDYVAARVYDDYIDTRNYYFQSGISSQGTGLYICARHTADLFSAWLLKVGANDTPYVNLDQTLRNFLGYECAPGKLFTDGDGTYELRNTEYLAGMAHISGYVFGDATVIAQAEYLLGDDYFGADTNYLTSGLYVALRGISTVDAAENRYEGMELIQYNGHPVGQYIVRMAWNDPTSAAVLMRIKERNTANHEHEDAGTFEIYYKGILTADGGCYNSYGSAHTAMYHQATISHNGLIIFNPSKWDFESKDKTVKWYSGSQNAPGEVSTLEKWLASEAHETGTVTGRAHAYSDSAKTKPLYAYIAGDITKAYPSDTVQFVERRMLTVYTGDEEFPMAFFVYDNVQSTDKSYEKRFLLQISSKNEPTVGKDRRLNPTVTTENGSGKLVLTLLNDDVSINLVGGRVYSSRGAYNSTKSSNYLINGYQNATTSNADDRHWGRVELVWKKATTSATFMNLIYVTDKGNDDAPAVRSIKDGVNVSGGIFDKKIVALFATDKNYTERELSCRTLGNETMDYYVSGVAAGAWRVTVDGVEIGVFNATEEGRLLTFKAPPGSIVISPID